MKLSKKKRGFTVLALVMLNPLCRYSLSTLWYSQIWFYCSY